MGPLLRRKTIPCEPKSASPPAEGGEDSCKPYIQAGDYYIALASKGATPSPPRVGVEASEESMLSEGTISMELIRDPRSAGL